MAFERSVVVDSKSAAQSEWQQMPEFVQEKQEPFAQIIFRFETEDDLDAFAELIGQKLTGKTKSAWHPHRPHRDPERRVYK
jgi:hypothetical protein